MEDSQMQLPIMEHFYTIQGEGSKVGTAAYFVRLAGCDVGCVWCDVKESWDAGKHEMHSVEEICSWVAQYPMEWVVITGGEPAMYDLTQLCQKLHRLGKKIAIETSAAYLIRGSFDWVCISPKKFKAPVASNWALADELKVVLFHKSDTQWALDMAQNVPAKTKLFVQPEWDKREERAEQIVDFVKDHPEWKISLQTHKYLNIP